MSEEIKILRKQIYGKFKEIYQILDRIGWLYQQIEEYATSKTSKTLQCAINKKKEDEECGCS